MFGYHGRVLIIDLGRREVRWDQLNPDVLLSFIGGIGLGSYLLYAHCPAKVDPLGPSNPLIFVCSPLVGSRLTTSSKFAVVTKSPLTGFIGDSLSSSFMATELKRTGCDAVIVTGKASSPTLLSIRDGLVEFLDAADLVGLSTSDTEKAVKDKLGSRTRVACIGPAGEKGVLFASISNDGGRQAGRTGPGAVMGSKNLKAIAVRGNNPALVYDPEPLNKIGNDLSRRSLGPATEKYRTLGTVANMSVFNRLGTLPTYNFKQSTFSGADKVSGEELHGTHFVRNAHCANCTIGCEKIVVTTDDKPQSSGRIEYESLFALGPLVGISDANSVIRSSLLCDQLGMDTVSAGATIAWAMESFEKGVLGLQDTDGIEMRFGNQEAVMSCLRLIGQRRGFGDLLAQGSRKASEIVGQGSEDWAMHVKGLELPGYEPRSLKTMALGLAVSTRGACHNRSSAYEADFSSRVDRLKVDKERGKITMEGEDFSSVLDSLIWCKFLRKAFDDFYAESAAIYEYVTGWEMTPDDLRRAGERISNLKKLFNIREGWERQDDRLPPRILRERLSTGVVQGAGLSAAELDMMIHSYYRARGWTNAGMIPNEKLEALGLSGIVGEPAMIS